jgi:hypothetical protein
MQIHAGHRIQRRRSTSRSRSVTATPKLGMPVARVWGYHALPRRSIVALHHSSGTEQTQNRPVGNNNQSTHIKTMKKTILLAALLISASLAAHAQNVISWAYNNGLAVSGTAGVVPAINWNLTGDAGSASLGYDNAVASGTTLTLAGGFGAWGIGGGQQDPDGTYNSAIFDGYYNSIGSTLSLGNISFSTYDVYVYFSSDADGRTGTISDGTTTFSFSTDARAKVDAHGNFPFVQTSDTGLSHPSADYAVFSNLTGAAQTFTIANASDGMGFAGIQIVAVPEPSTLALAGLSLLGFAMRRRVANS